MLAFARRFRSATAARWRVISTSRSHEGLARSPDATLNKARVAAYRRVTPKPSMSRAPDAGRVDAVSERIEGLA